jgi:hypothetical protein
MYLVAPDTPKLHGLFRWLYESFYCIKSACARSFAFLVDQNSFANSTNVMQPYWRYGLNVQRITLTMPDLKHILWMDTAPNDDFDWALNSAITSARLWSQRRSSNVLYLRRSLALTALLRQQPYS